MVTKIVIAILIIVAGFAVYRFTSNDSTTKTTVSTNVPTKTIVESNPVEDKRRVLFFFANWCPTCKAADKSLKSNEARIPKDVEIVKVNYNDSETDADEEALANRYGITYQHTFVQIDKDGNEVTKWNGGGFDELINNIR